LAFLKVLGSSYWKFSDEQPYPPKRTFLNARQGELEEFLGTKTLTII